MTKKSEDINYISKDLFPKTYNRTMIDDDYIKQLEQENKQLKDNWDYIKKMLKGIKQEEFNINGYCGICTDIDIDFLLNKIQKLEQRSNSNEI